MGVNLGGIGEKKKGLRGRKEFLREALGKVKERDAFGEG